MEALRRAYGAHGRACGLGKDANVSIPDVVLGSSSNTTGMSIKVGQDGVADKADRQTELYGDLPHVDRIYARLLWFLNYDNMPGIYSATPKDLAGRLCSLDIGWSGMSGNFANGEHIFTNLQKLVIWFDLEDVYKDIDMEHLAESIDRVIPPQCQVQLRYIMESPNWPANRVLLNREEDDFIDHILQWEAYIVNRRSEGSI